MPEGVREIIFCPICGEVIHRQFSGPITSRGVVSSRTDPATASAVLTEMMLAAEAEHQRMLRTVEEICAEHMRTRHSTRFGLWQRFGWNWLLTRPWPWSSKPEYDEFEFPGR